MTAHDCMVLLCVVNCVFELQTSCVCVLMITIYGLPPICISPHTVDCNSAHGWELVALPSSLEQMHTPLGHTQQRSIAPDNVVNLTIITLKFWIEITISSEHKALVTAEISRMRSLWHYIVCVAMGNSIISLSYQCFELKLCFYFWRQWIRFFSVLFFKGRMNSSHSFRYMLYLVWSLCLGEDRKMYKSVFWTEVIRNTKAPSRNGLRPCRKGQVQALKCVTPLLVILFTKQWFAQNV